VTLITGALTLDSGATLAGPDSFVARGLTTLSFGAALSVPAVDAYGGMQLTGPSTLTGTNLTNHAAATWDVLTGHTITLDAGATIDNPAGASFIVAGGNVNCCSDIVPGDASAVAFDNAGSFTSAIGSGTLTIAVPFANAGTVDVQSAVLELGDAMNSGTVTVSSGTILGIGTYAQTAGSTALNGVILSGGSLNINGGALTGTATINASVSNGGQVIPGGTGAVGTLTINGSYTQSSTGTLLIDVGGTTPGSQYDQLAVSAAAALGGTVDVALINGFQPAFSNSVQVLTFGSSSGIFANYNAPSLTSGLFLDSVFSPSSLTLDIDRVAISGAPAFLLEGIPINLTATVSGPSVGHSFSFSWTVTQNGNPFGSGAGSTFSFTPNLNATYLVSLTVTDVAGATGTTSLQLIVAPSIFVVNP
jgi:hypothetical protein